MRISALCLEFPGNHRVSRKSALCQMSKSRPGLLRFWRVGGITVLAVEAQKRAILRVVGEDRVRVARDGDNNKRHACSFRQVDPIR